MKRPGPLTRADYRVFRTIPTRWADNDMYGHANNVVYFEWIDTAVNSWLIEQGLIDPFHGETIGLVVETGCTYFSSLAYPQIVEAGLAAEHVGRSSVRYRIGLFAQGEDKAAAQGLFTHVYVTKATMRPLAMPARLRAAVEGILV